VSSEKQELDRLGLTQTFAQDAAPAPLATPMPMHGDDRRPVVSVPAPRESDQLDEHIGQRIGSYRIVRELGRGGMGIVYEAVHDQLGQRAVIKTLQPQLSQNQAFSQRFLVEARAISIVQHPGLVKIFDFGQLPDKTLYILMEHLAGEPLSDRLCREKLDEPSALRLARQIASTLQVAHERGVIHRDLKPANIFVIPDPEAPAGERVKLLDFGLAKIEEGPAGSGPRSTTPGTIMGTPVYMSPENEPPEAERDPIGPLVLQRPANQRLRLGPMGNPTLDRSLMPMAPPGRSRWSTALTTARNPGRCPG
jgi:serine/threonine protein kinase